MSEEQTAADTQPKDEGDLRSHLDDVPDGCGCVELWTELTEHRESGVGEGEPAEST